MRTSREVWRWGTVTSVGPLRVTLDTEDEAADMTPDTLVPDLMVGDRVRCQLAGRRMIIYGKAY